MTRHPSKSALTGVCIGSMVLGTSAFASSAIAAEQVVLSYQGTQITIGRQELNSFTDTGVVPAPLQDLLGSDVDLPDVVRTVLSREIRVPAFVDKFLGSATGEFVLSQLDSSIGSTSGGTEKDLLSLKSAFSSAASDDRISFIELIDQYPQNSVRVDLSNLEGTYNRVANFVENVQPALEVAKGFLSDIICDCNATSVTSENTSQTDATTGMLYASDSQPCNSALESAVALEPSDETIELSNDEPSEDMTRLSAQ